MTPAPATLQPPSWRRPILLGAMLVALLHAPAVAENILWVAIYGTFGVTGMLSGLLPAIVACKREPGLSPGSGFAVAFIAAGLGMVALVVITLLQGFTIPASTEQAWRTELTAGSVTAEEVDEFFANLRGGTGDVVAVMAATFVAFGAGISGALVAALRARRARRA